MVLDVVRLLCDVKDAWTPSFQGALEQAASLLMKMDICGDTWGLGGRVKQGLG